jgi:hypothetical protein
MTETTAQEQAVLDAAKAWADSWERPPYGHHWTFGALYDAARALPPNTLPDEMLPPSEDRSSVLVGQDGDVYRQVDIAPDRDLAALAQQLAEALRRTVDRACCHYRRDDRHWLVPTDLEHCEQGEYDCTHVRALLAAAGDKLKAVQE